jgi:cellulose synthase (UDP-forming)
MQPQLTGTGVADLEAGSVPPFNYFPPNADRLRVDETQPAAGASPSPVQVHTGTRARHRKPSRTNPFRAVHVPVPTAAPTASAVAPPVAAAPRAGAVRRQLTQTRADMPALPAEVRIPAPREQEGQTVLPVPPSDKEKYSYVRRHNWVLTTCMVLTFPPLVYSQFRMFEDSPWFLFYAPFVLLGILTFFVSLIADGIGKGFDLNEHKKIVASWLPLWYPSVDIYLPTCGEPIELLRNTWTYVAALRATYNGKLTPYVLDDAARPEVKKMAKQFGFAYATRPDRGVYKKSGNLRYGFEISDGDFILLLDADFAPRADLLDEMLPYFALFPDVGIVQSPQYFHVVDEQTWVERGAGAIQELFYRSIQSTRARKSGAICVGSCAVYRRAALEQNGGMSLAEHSEDLHTGFDLYVKGWQLRYLPIALSTGNCPDNVLAFLNQQYRWCSGTMSLLRERKFWEARLPLYSRVCYLAGVAGYVYTAIFTFIAPALAIGMLLFAPTFLLFRNIVFVAPVLFYAGVIYPMWHRAPYRLEAWSVRMLSGWAHVFALWDIMRGRLHGWQPSGTGAKRQDGRNRLWIGLIGWGLGTAVLWSGLGLWRMVTWNAYDFFLTFALGVFQLAVVGRILLQPRNEPAS